MKVKHLLAVLCLSSSIPATAQFNIGIQAASSNPLKGTLDALPILRSGYAVRLTPDYQLGKWHISSVLGYQSLNVKNGFKASLPADYTQDKSFGVSAPGAGFFQAALGAGFNVLPGGNNACGLPKLALLIEAKGGVLAPINAIDLVVTNKAGGTQLGIQQDKKTLPFFNVGLQLLYPVCPLVKLTTGVHYSQTLNDMMLTKSSNGTTTNFDVSYKDLQIGIGVQVSFKGHSEKGMKRTAKGHSEKGMKYANATPAAMTEGQPIGGIVVSSAPHGDTHALVAGQPIGGIVVSGAPHGDTHARVSGDSANHPTSPLYDANTNGGVNVLGGEKVVATNGATSTTSGEPQALVAGSPIGGIVVKGGQNPTRFEVANDSTTTTGATANRTAGNPIGGIIVKGGQNPKGNSLTEANPSGNANQPGQPAQGVVTNPLYQGSGTSGVNPMSEAHVAGNPSGTSGQPAEGVVKNPLYQDGGMSGTNPMSEARVAGNPIPGVVVKGGKNPGMGIAAILPGKSIPDANGKGITEKGIKRMAAPDANGKGITEKGIKRQEDAQASRKGHSEKGMKLEKTSSVTYENDFSVNNPALSQQLGVKDLVIAQGDYAFDYTNNSLGDLTLDLKEPVKTSAGSPVQGKASDKDHNYTYTVTPVISNGAATKIIVSYKSINEKGIK